MSSQIICTIGVYGTTKSSFFGALVNANVTFFLDVRQRRGLRGGKYAYANATALKSELSSLGIAYLHVKQLAPTSNVRTTQQLADSDAGISKAAREVLAPTFVQAYRSEVLTCFDLVPWLAAFPKDAVICLFCVERLAAACHRSLIAEAMSSITGNNYEDITP